MKRIENRLNRDDLQAIQIINIYRQATPSEIAEGQFWYSKANQISLYMANKFNCPITKVVGVLSALSPGTNWQQNVADAHNLIMAWHYLIDPSEVIMNTYGQNKRKAVRILNLRSSEVTDVEKLLLHKSKINKTASFFWNILRVKETEFVTIDRHAVRIALGPEFRDNVYMTEKRYRTTVKAYKRAAKEVNLKPHELQAIVWCAYRRINQIENGFSVQEYKEIENQVFSFHPQS